MTDHIIQAAIQSVLFAFIGVIVLALAFFGICKVMPFSVRKEIEIDHNTALGIVLGALIIGLSVIIASAIH